MTKKLNLEHDFELQIRNLGEKVSNFPWHNEAAYAGWLAQTYYFVRHTTTLVAMVAAKYGADHREQHYAMLGHLADERGHDTMALSDLENLGWSLNDWPELPETSLFYQNQYYMIQHQGPTAHLGYSLCLEGLAAMSGPKLHQELLRQYGVNCVSFIGTHATLDQDHFAHGVEQLKHLSQAEIHSVRKNLEQSSALYKMMCDRIADIAAAITSARKKSA